MCASSKARSATRTTWRSLHQIRARTKVLVSFGDCAVTGNVPAMRNQLGLANVENVLQRAYIENAQTQSLRARRPTASCRRCWTACMPVHEVVQVEYFLPGCPPPAARIKALLAQLLAGDAAATGRRTDSNLAESDLSWQNASSLIPVTRIEGHAKISIFMDDAGNVSDAEFHVVEFRGFEKFCEGRPFSEMPGITPRICGICPVSHLLASAKAGDAIMAVNIPPAADKLRRLMNLGQIVQSHALSFFHLSAPDFLLGWDTPPAQRNVFGLIAANAELARAGIRLRQFGQEIIEILGGKKIHPAWAVPGGVRSALTEEGRAKIRAWLPEAFATTEGRV